MERVDYFLQNPPRLPKLEVADYVQSQGILIPKIYRSFQEAADSGKPFLMRSENPQDYAGASDLFPSYLVDRQKILDDINRRVPALDVLWYFEHRPCDSGGSDDLEQFQGLFWQHFLDNKNSITQQEIDQTLREWPISTEMNFSRLGLQYPHLAHLTTYSYWEYLKGQQVSIYADDVIPQRYHFFRSEYPYYQVYDNGEINQKCEQVFQMKETHPANIFTEGTKLYEKVTSLPFFDPSHRYIMECLFTPDNKCYFLQFHRGRDFQEADFALKRPPSPSGVAVDFVRGVTPEEGIIVKTRLHYFKVKNAEGIRFDFKGWEDEEGSFDNPLHSALININARRRRLQLIAKIHPGIHSFVSQIAKPQVSIVLDPSRIFPDWPSRERGGFSNYPTYANLQVISDGEKAFVKVV